MTMEGVQRRQRRLDVAEVVRLRTQGLPVSHIAGLMGVSGQAIRNVLQEETPARAGRIVVAARQVQRIDRDQLARLAEAGYSIGAIAESLQVSCGSVRRALLQLRRQSESDPA